MLSLFVGCENILDIYNEKQKNLKTNAFVKLNVKSKLKNK